MTEPALTLPDRSLALPVVEGTEPPSGLDVSRLLAETGFVTYDPGFVDTAACTSAITFVDGDAGILRYRGYPIDELARSSSFLEVSYLLVYGELPTREQLEHFTEQVRIHTLLHPECFQRLIANLGLDAPKQRLEIPQFLACGDDHRLPGDRFNPTALDAAELDHEPSGARGEFADGFVGKVLLPLK